MGEMGPPPPDFPLLRHRRGQRHLAETLRPLLVLLLLCATVEAKVASQGGGERKCECTVITMRRQLTSVASRTRISCGHDIKPSEKFANKVFRTGHQKQLTEFQ